jgi:hypothetical protein
MAYNTASQQREGTEMNKPILKLPRKLICWTVEKSHLFNPPRYIEATSLEELRRRIQKYADEKPPREGIPPMGEITFRYETEGDEVVCVHSFFTNRYGNAQRFMRVRRNNR